MNSNGVNIRLDRVRALVEEMIISIQSAERRQAAYVHLYGASNCASLLAKKRGLNQEIAAVSGLLHDYYFYKTGVSEFPGLNSADTVRPLLRTLNMFTDEELTIILQAIFYRDDPYRTRGPYTDILKDAYAMQCTGGMLTQEKTILQDVDRRRKLADTAEALARENIIGVPEDQRYREICKYWPDEDIYNVLQRRWCAAFVYYCCMQVGFLLPIRYPNAMYRLAGVGAWLEWSQLPETGFFHMDKHDGFAPQRGDIVIYEKLLSADSHDHIGIILACNDDEIVVAEGNKDNQNYSSVLSRDRSHCILGYIRIDNSYQFDYNDDYIPIR
ncbi:CHAP domain-containing protein [Paenibacillus guangzhouensis]|uniref:CHAP domain-containing protein n=1 Tax=Paenibacillus guangzhouensis TaxID=1473112 RepID=UPI001D12968A|nr:CHAP domain-containing protein [Paenibacillus guangzhouensis]